jgi:AAA family ATP:ADP antiporter
VLRVRRQEVVPVLLAAAYFFCLLSAYYLLRPIREAMGLAGGVRNLKWLYLGTLAAMLVASPIFSALVSRLRRGVFIPIVYIFFVANLGVFIWLFRVTPEPQQVVLARVFYIWTSVFNLFAVSVFWSFMTDLFRPQQGKRLFGIIGVGGTLGAIVGAGLAAWGAERVGDVSLMPVSMFLLLVACAIVLRLNAWARRWSERRARRRRASARDDGDRPVYGSVWAGMVQVVRSPYLMTVCLYLFLLTLGSTIVYFLQADIVAGAFETRAARVAVFGKIDLAVNVLTVVTQVLVTGRLIARFGVGGALAIVPALSVIGFIGLGLAPTLGVLIAFQTCRRAMNYAITRPARESLFTVVSREQKYKSKNFIDTFVYRGGDVVGAGGFAWLTGKAVALGLAGVSFLAAPIAVLWILVGVKLGRDQQAMQRGARAKSKTDGRVPVESAVD